MRHVFAAVLLLVLGGAAPAAANSMACGLRPIAPPGCASTVARCVCEASGECRWVFDC